MSYQTIDTEHLTTEKIFELAKKCIDNKEYTKAKELFESIIHCHEAVVELALIYQHGKGVPVDLNKAKELCEKAILQKNTYAMNNLAYMYLYEQGISIDIKMAKKLFKMAIKQDNNPLALCNMAAIYQFKDGYINYTKAKDLSEKAILLGISASMVNLAFMYANEQGVPLDLNKAKELLKMAIKVQVKEKSDFLDITVNMLYTLLNDLLFMSLDDILETFYELGEIERIKKHYNNAHICTFIKLKKLEKKNETLIKKNKTLKKDNGDLRAHIMASHDGEAYFEALSSWTVIKEKLN